MQLSPSTFTLNIIFIHVAFRNSELVLVMPKIAGYTHDRPHIANPSALGFGMCIKNSVTDDNYDNTCSEDASIKMFLDGKYITIINAYNPHDSEVVPNLLTAYIMILSSVGILMLAILS